MTLLITDKVGYKTKKITKKDILIKGSICQKDILILNVCITQSKALKFKSKHLQTSKGKKVGESAISIGDSVDLLDRKA